MSIIEQVRYREEELRAAMLASNVPALSLLIDDGLVFTGPDGEVVSKEQDLSAHESGILSLSRLDLRRVRLHPIGDMVLATTKADLAGTYAGAAIDGVFSYSRLWSKASGEWRVIAGHAARLS